ncbi:YraN family protein [Parvularcula sp. IMCC14364]|uniref:YraN family protein n=1 Tax=Parvularcula sp. IMCC14364 TaxID=3067902 RepID=UPI0027411CDC|nr:YraN family protein [Parvularcula sp. IMCC14364]
MTEKRKSERRGRFAEHFAVAILSLKGYRILARRWKCSVGEIDIIASRNGTLVFVEVKSRKSVTSAIEAVGWQNRRRIEQAASAYAQTKRLTPVPVFRFDVFAMSGWRNWQHRRDAWRSGD